MNYQPTNVLTATSFRWRYPITWENTCNGQLGQRPPLGVYFQNVVVTSFNTNSQTNALPDQVEDMG